MRTLAIALLVAGCSGGGGTDDAAVPDGGAPQDMAMAPADMTWATATHLPYPQMNPHFSHVLTSPELVTVTYSNDPHAAQFKMFGDFLPTSQWLQATGTELGVTGMTHQARSWGTNAPGSINEGQIVTNLKAAAMAGTLPMPSSVPDDGGVRNEELLYLLYLPYNTMFNDRNGTPSCQTYLGFHYTSKLNGVGFYYAILPDCTGNISDIESTASHEILEAISDPAGDGFYLDVDQSSPWWGLNGFENGDLCQDMPDVTEGVFTLQRIYSNAAAMSGTSYPCVPTPSGEAVFGITTDPPMPAFAAAGKSVTFHLTGWSLVPMNSWKLTTPFYPAFTSDFDPKAQLPASTLNNGRTVTVTLSVPLTAGSGQQGTAQIFSGTNGYYWPLTVIAQ